MRCLVGAAIVFTVWRFVELFVIFGFFTTIAAIELRVVVFLSTPRLSCFCDFVLVAVAQVGVVGAALPIAIHPAYIVGAGHDHSIGAIGLIT